MSMASTTSATSFSSDGDGCDGDGNGYDGGDSGKCNIQNTNTDSSVENSSLVPLSDTNNKTRKKREELSISATKSIKKEKVEIVVNFN
jgi:hypothetical protein